MTLNSAMARPYRRRDWCEKTSLALVRSYDTITFENLRIANMVRSAKGTVDAPGTNVTAKAGLNRSIQESCWGQLARRTQDKAEASGVTFLRVDAAHTSQRCSRCGQTDPANRPARDRFGCVACGHEDHADTNAATNIHAAGPVVDGRNKTDQVRDCWHRPVAGRPLCDSAPRPGALRCRDSGPARCYGSLDPAHHSQPDLPSAGHRGRREVLGVAVFGQHHSRARLPVGTTRCLAAAPTDLAGVLVPLHAVPGLFKLTAVLFGPLEDHAFGSWRQPALCDPEVFDAHRSLASTVFGMEVGPPVFPEVHPDDDAVEATDLRHRLGPEALGTAPLGSCR